MKKKNIILSIIIIIFVLLLIPIPFKLKDGGSVEYKAILYSFTKYHSINTESIKGYDDGWKVKILGLTVYDKINTYVYAEHVISIKSDDEIVNANTGSFCYMNGTCVDKIEFQDFKYDVISTYYGDKLYIDNLDGTIKSIELFDYSSSEFIKTKVEFTDEYIITPNISGSYIFVIKAIYQGKNIEYYFMTDINEINDDKKNEIYDDDIDEKKDSNKGIEIDDVDMEFVIQLKENTLSDTGLTMILKNQSNKDIEYTIPYTIEKYQDGYWKTMDLLDDISFASPVYRLHKGETEEISINWEKEYGKLLYGKYRIVKKIFYVENEEYNPFDKYLEFEIK